MAQLEGDTQAPTTWAAPAGTPIPNLEAPSDGPDQAISGAVTRFAADYRADRQRSNTRNSTKQNKWIALGSLAVVVAVVLGGWWLQRPDEPERRSYTVNELAEVTWESYDGSTQEFMCTKWDQEGYGLKDYLLEGGWFDGAGSKVQRHQVGMSIHIPGDGLFLASTDGYMNAFVRKTRSMCD